MRYVLDVPDLVIGGLSIDPILAFGGLLAGLLVGLTGMGGAALVTPMLVLVFGVPPAAAVSSDVVASAAMKPVGSWVHIRARTVHWRMVWWLSVGSIPGVLIGTWIFARVLDTEEEAKEYLYTKVGKGKIEVRVGEKFKRCERYCNASAFCKQYQEGTENEFA